MRAHAGLVHRLVLQEHVLVDGSTTLVLVSPREPQKEKHETPQNAGETS